MLLWKLLILSVTALALPGVQQQPHSNDEERAGLTDQRGNEFQKLLEALPDQCIHDVLKNQLEHFKDGVFQYNKAALQKIHSTDPPLATKLMSAAALEAYKMTLNKRQTPNNTVTGVPTPNSQPSQVPNSPNSPPPVAPTVSIDAIVTTTDQRGNTITTSVAQPAVVLTSTDSAGSSIIVTSAVTPSLQPVTTTDSAGSTFVTDTIPSQVRASSLVLQTTTLPNGQVSTITSFAVVDPTATGAAGSGSNNPSNTVSPPSPSLQSGSASLMSWRVQLETAALISLSAGFAWFL